VKNEYAGINFIDIYQRTGAYAVPLPFIPGREASGTVVEVGEAVPDLQVGDDVVVLSGATYAEYTAVDRRLVCKIPPGISKDDAVAVFLQGMTAAYLATDSYKVQPGDYVFLPVC
jgi:NADPH2:quinone reductase